MVVCECVKTNEIMAPSKKSDGTEKGWLRVERTRGYFAIVQRKDKNLDYSGGFTSALQKI